MILHWGLSSIGVMSAGNGIFTILSGLTIETCGCVGVGTYSGPLTSSFRGDYMVRRPMPAPGASGWTLVQLKFGTPDGLQPWLSVLVGRWQMLGLQVPFGIGMAGQF